MSNDAIHVYVACAREDEALLTELGKHLSTLKRENTITSWDNRQIIPGEVSDDVITRNLKTAQVIVLLISADFLASDELWQLGMTQAIHRHYAGVAKVVPIILRPCDWNSAPFRQLAVLPKDGKPVTKWDDQDEAFLDIAMGIRRAVSSLQRTPQFQELQEPKATQLDLPKIREPKTLKKFLKPEQVETRSNKLRNRTLWMSTVIFFVGLLIRSSGLLQPLELAMYDHFLRIRSAMANEQLDDRIRLVAIDQNDIEMFQTITHEELNEKPEHISAHGQTTGEVSNSSGACINTVGASLPDCVYDAYLKNYSAINLLLLV
ncbi:MAG: TIR domain-containing protein [Cyanobacteria bacterium P01_E01_bin.6]